MVSSESRGSPSQRTGSIPVITFQEEPNRTSDDRPSPVSQAGVSILLLLLLFALYTGCLLLCIILFTQMPLQLRTLLMRSTGQHLIHHWSKEHHCACHVEAG
ncbi:hypothetical protein J3458_021931 [Metarhizium acridum]|uniref:uncharacterized protein n=1 Tax=Metarhizium acridum TaxID=92637 RepID=UPI001C6AA999|nr:hypothetical protein J3458_021931 [Metarhizium acridum]